MMSDKKVAAVIFVLAFMTRLLFVLLTPSHPLAPDGTEFDRLGLSLSRGAGYVNSLGEPTAMRPPLYPLFLGIIYFIAGHDLFWVRLMQALLGAGICLLTYLIATVIFDRTIASISGFICCFYPPLIVQTSEIMSEILFTFLLLFGIWKLISGNNFLGLLVSGIILGAAVLTRSNLVFFFPFLLYWIFLSQKRKFFKALALFVCGLLVVLLPWTLRNYARFHAWIPLVTPGGGGLYISFIVPEKGFGYVSFDGVDDEYFKLKSETEQSDYLTKKALDFIKKNPDKVALLTAIKWLHFIYPFDGYWYSLSFGSKYNIFWGIIFCFSLLALVNNYKKRDMNKRLVYFVLYSSLISVVIFFGIPRFRLPIEPLLICFASSGIFRLFKKNKYAFSTIVAANVVVFMIFRFFRLQDVFDYLKTWI